VEDVEPILELKVIHHLFEESLVTRIELLLSVLKLSGIF
jgi:hypothetical protein